MAQSDQSTDRPFDATARSIIELRQPIVQAHLERWQATPAALSISVAPGQQDWLINLEHIVCQTSTQDFDERSRGRDTWLDAFLLPLGRDLDLIQVAETTILHQMYRTGSFDVFDSATDKNKRPPEDPTIEATRSLFQSVPHHSHRVSQLVARQLCRDNITAIG